MPQTTEDYYLRVMIKVLKQLSMAEFLGGSWGGGNLFLAFFLTASRLLLIFGSWSLNSNQFCYQAYMCLGVVFMCVDPHVCVDIRACVCSYRWNSEVNLMSFLGSLFSRQGLTFENGVLLSARLFGQ